MSKSIRLGFGITALAKGLKRGSVDGIGVCARELMGRLVNYSNISLVQVNFATKFDNHLEPTSQIFLGRFAPRVALSCTLGVYTLGSKKIESNVDIFHSTDHYIPKLKKVPSIATIHDAIPFEHPEWVSSKYRFLICPAFKKSASWADRVITVSNYSRDKIEEYFEIDRSRISVVPNGVDQRWFNSVDREDLGQIWTKLGLKKSYIIFVGTLQPRKNVERLIQAYKNLPLPFRDSFDLLIVGRTGWGCKSLISLLGEQPKDGPIRWLDDIDNSTLEGLVKGASCMAFPSLAEGFGLPILEAFASGVVVLTSNLASMPEVACGGAILVDPFDIDSISEGLIKALDDTELIEKLKIIGMERAKLFTWDRTAEETSRVYRSLV
jgi:glycosyltransferase involved in cell wall biosynthesis